MVKIARNGNGSTVTIPRAVMEHLGWLTGEHVVMAVNEDRTLTLQRVTREDLRAAAQRCIAAESHEVTAP